MDLKTYSAAFFVKDIEASWTFAIEIEQRTGFIVK